MTVEQPRARAFLTPRGAILSLLLLGLLFSSVYPMRRYLTVQSQIEALRAEERRLDARIDELNEERDRLLSDAEVERLAREQLGMVRPGEVPFLIVTPYAAPSPPAVDPGGFAPAEPRQRDPMLLRWWEAMKRASAALK